MILRDKSDTPKTPYLAIDCVILNDKNEVLLIKKTHNLFKDHWAIPGGHVEYGETVESAVAREVKEEVGLTIDNPSLFGVYSDPSRDPRYHLVAILYIVRNFKGDIKGNYESSEQIFFKLDQLPEKIVADHRTMLNDVSVWLKKS